MAYRYRTTTGQFAVLADPTTIPANVEMLTIDAALQVSSPLLLGTGAYEARVAWNGSTFLAVYGPVDAREVRQG